MLFSALLVAYGMAASVSEALFNQSRNQRRPRPVDLCSVPLEAFGMAVSVSEPLFNQPRNHKCPLPVALCSVQWARFGMGRYVLFSQTRALSNKDVLPMRTLSSVFLKVLWPLDTDENFGH